MGDTISGSTGVAGGGIWNLGGGYLTLTNVTIANNTSTYGGGIYNSSAGVVELHDVTIAGNKATSGGGGVYNASGGTVGVANTIIATNSLATTTTPLSDVSGVFGSAGYNLIGSTYGSSGWLSTDLTGTGTVPLNPMLGSYESNRIH
jgi:hypothetical protein